MANRYQWELPENKTILFMGASHIQSAINDNYMENAINIAHSSERYPFTYLKLQKIISNKNNKIEHIVLECAPPDLSQIADQKIFNVESEMLRYIPLYYPYFHEDEWRLYNNYILDIATILLSRFYRNWALTPKKYFSQYGGFHDNKVHRQVMDENKIEFEKIDSLYFGNEVNHSYLRKIANVCKSNNIRLTLLYCPMYKPELYYDQEYYYNVLKTKFNDIEYLDYSHLDIPMNFRRDAHHLNTKYGTPYFTQLLAERLGLKCKTLQE
jgi:hypothetical protein